MAGRQCTDVRFYTMGDSRYFLGAVALVNSLRRVGHHEPITMLDLGLTEAQRVTLAAECEIVDLPRFAGDHPFTFQPYPHLLDPHGICVILDSDVIVTGRLDGLVDAARCGSIGAFADNFSRFEPAWDSLFQLRAPLVPSTYVNSGIVALHGSRHREFLARWWNLCRSLDVAMPPSLTNPVGFADQDALNALLMSEFRDEQFVVEDVLASIGPLSLRATKVADVDSLRCVRDNRQVVALHSTSQPKPWSHQARFLLRRNAYITSLSSLLCSEQNAIHVSRGDIPLWLKPGARAAATRLLMQEVGRVRRSFYDTRVRVANGDGGAVEAMVNA